MTRVITKMRCVPRFGYDFTEVRTVELEISHGAEEEQLHRALNHWFLQYGIEEAVFTIDVDDDGFFAVINDEAYHQPWGTPVEL